MSTHLKIFRFSRSRCFRRLSTLILGLLVVSFCYGQYQPVQVTFSILPPYTPDIYKDYQQLSATLISSEPVECYLKVSLEGEGGIHIFSAPGFKPLTPLTLMPHTPYIINSTNWQEAADLNHMMFEGITKEDMLINGLPEGNYFFCLQVMDYMTNFPLSQEAPAGCANFIISTLSPPSFTDCREFMTFPTPQFANPVIWMSDPATPASAYYLLAGKKVPLGMNAQQAWNLETIPVLFERTVKETFYMLTGMDLGDISIDNQFVIAVKVVDPEGKIIFENNGWSVPCSFAIIATEPVVHRVEISNLAWPPGHPLALSKGWPPDHPEDVSKTWPPGHKPEPSKTWPADHTEAVSKTWPANHTGPYSLTWPKDHTAEKSPTWPPDHHGERTVTWPEKHKADNSKMWPANHIGSISSTWQKHTPAVSKTWPANHDAKSSNTWTKHDAGVSKTWPANHEKDNSRNWLPKNGHDALKSPTWPANHTVNFSKKWTDHSEKRSQGWSGDHVWDKSKNWPPADKHEQIRSKGWPANHSGDKSSTWPGKHKVQDSQGWPPDHDAKKSANSK
jgi:hypothetical protein